MCVCANYTSEKNSYFKKDSFFFHAFLFLCVCVLFNILIQLIFFTIVFFTFVCVCVFTVNTIHLLILNFFVFFFVCVFTFVVLKRKKINLFPPPLFLKHNLQNGRRYLQLVFFCCCSTQPCLLLLLLLQAPLLLLPLQLVHLLRLLEMLTH